MNNYKLRGDYGAYRALGIPGSLRHYIETGNYGVGSWRRYPQSDLQQKSRLKDILTGGAIVMSLFAVVSLFKKNKSGAGGIFSKIKNKVLENVRKTKNDASDAAQSDKIGIVKKLFSKLRSGQNSK